MIEQTYINKSEWPEGPWHNEVDFRFWPEGDVPCMMGRNPWSGNWLAYVGVPNEHPWHGKNGEDLFDVHGGCTYSGYMAHDDMYVFHFTDDDPRPSLPNTSVELIRLPWWLGWDYHHGFDYAPGMAAFYAKNMIGRNILEEKYYTQAEVVKEVEAVVNQAVNAVTRGVIVPGGEAPTLEGC